MLFERIYSLSEVKDVAKEVIENAKSKCIAFYGGMGSGKTTLIAAICEYLEVLDLVSSPTFAIVNEYDTKSSGKIYHFDFYRIQEPDELLDIGIEEYISSNEYLFIEWPELGEDFLPQNLTKIQLIQEKDGERKLIME